MNTNKSDKIETLAERFSSASQKLSSLEVFGIKLGLDQVEELLRFAGEPQKELKFIHIAGTNGKGSVAAMLSSCLKEVGLNVGLYTSPHLVSVRERFRVNGRAISEEDFSECVESIWPAVEAMKEAGRCPTYFETTTALAIDYFHKRRVDVVVWETGLGGRFDATNVVDPICSVITSIGLDHQAYLGDTLEKIAFEKAGIIKPGRPVVVGELVPEALAVVAKRCEELASDLYKSDDDSEVLADELLAYSGFAWRCNAKIAKTVLKVAREELGIDWEKAISQGMPKTRWPGRFQVLPDGNIVDGAHNPQGATALVDFIRSTYPKRMFTVVFANFADKNAVEMLQELSKITERFLFIPFQSGSRKAHSTDWLMEQVEKIQLDVPCQTCDSLDDALKLAPRGHSIITGSLYLIGDVLKRYFSTDEIVDL